MPRCDFPSCFCPTQKDTRNIHRERIPTAKWRNYFFMLSHIINQFLVVSGFQNFRPFLFFHSDDFWSFEGIVDWNWWAQNWQKGNLKSTFGRCLRGQILFFSSFLPDKTNWTKRICSIIKGLITFINTKQHQMPLNLHRFIIFCTLKRL